MTPTDPKLIQALIDNHLGKPRGDDISLAFGLRWVPAPDGFLCPHCKGALERTMGLTMGSAFAGSVRCAAACGYQHSVCGYLGQSMIQVEPMPPGALPAYDQDPGVIDAILEPACAHVGEECNCGCHNAPILHHVACCSPCHRCGFRTIESP